MWAITGSAKDVIAKGFVLLLAGIPVYIGVKGWARYRAARMNASLEAAGRRDGQVAVEPSGVGATPIGAHR